MTPAAAWSRPLFKVRHVLPSVSLCRLQFQQSTLPSPAETGPAVLPSWHICPENCHSLNIPPKLLHEKILGVLACKEDGDQQFLTAVSRSGSVIQTLPISCLPFGLSKTITSALMNKRIEPLSCDWLTVFTLGAVRQGGQGVCARHRRVSCNHNSPLTNSSGSSSRPILFFSITRLFISSDTSEIVCLCGGTRRILWLLLSHLQPSPDSPGGLLDS